MKQHFIDFLRALFRLVPFVVTFLVAMTAVQIVLPNAREVHLPFALICVGLLVIDKFRNANRN
jgi:hypothetical protein